MQEICLWFFRFQAKHFQSQRKNYLEYSYCCYIRKVREKNKGEISKRKRKNKDSWYGNQSGLTREKWYLLENYSQIFTFCKTKIQVCSISKISKCCSIFLMVYKVHRVLGGYLTLPKNCRSLSLAFFGAK